MEVCHVESAVFDDPNLVSCAGLGPVVALAEQCGLPQLVAAQLTLPAKAGVNAHLKVPALVGAMVAGADSIADTRLDVRRALIIILSRHTAGDKVYHSEIFTALRALSISVERVGEVLEAGSRGAGHRRRSAPQPGPAVVQHRVLIGHRSGGPYRSGARTRSRAASCAAVGTATGVISSTGSRPGSRPTHARTRSSTLWVPGKGVAPREAARGHPRPTVEAASRFFVPDTTEAGTELGSSEDMEPQPPVVPVSYTHLRAH